MRKSQKRQRWECPQCGKKNPAKRNRCLKCRHDAWRKVSYKFKNQDEAIRVITHLLVTNGDPNYKLPDPPATSMVIEFEPGEKLCLAAAKCDDLFKPLGSIGDQ